MTEETALCSLEKALSKEADTVRITATGADFGEQETLCPLYLRFADGRRALLFTAGDGADGCADGSLLPCAVFGAESVFERFGVPMDAAGYTHNTDGTTTVTNSVGGGASDGMTSTARYDVQGRLVYWERLDVGQSGRYGCPYPRRFPTARTENRFHIGPLAFSARATNIQRSQRTSIMTAAISRASTWNMIRRMFSAPDTTTNCAMMSRTSSSPMFSLCRRQWEGLPERQHLFLVHRGRQRCYYHGHER